VLVVQAQHSRSQCHHIRSGEDAMMVPTCMLSMHMSTGLLALHQQM
jgi:hypothetical protein